MNQEVGKISYVVEIDTKSLRAGTKSVEDSITATMYNTERATERAGKGVDKFGQRLRAVENNLKPIATASAVASGVVVAGFTNAATAAFQQVRAVENASFGLRAYEKDAASVNAVLGQLIQFARSDAGVLFQREELFQAASTLKGFGEATSELNNRVQVLAKGVAVGNTTFAELSQIVGRSAQQGKLTAEAFDQLAYRGIILDSSLRGAAVGADQLYEAIDGAIDDSILSGRANTIDGLLTRLNSAWRDLGSTILGVDRNTSQFIAGGLGAFITSTIASITEFIRGNQALIGGVGTSVVVFGSLVGVLFVAVRAFTAARAALTALGVAGAVAQARMLGLLGILSAIVGLGVGAAIQNQLDNSTSSLEGLNAELDDTTNFGTAASDAMGDLQKQLRSLDEQVAKTNRDFEENLARIVRRHQDSVKELTAQIERENTNYNAAVAKRLTAFQEQQGKEEAANQEKVNAIQTQIDFLQRYDNQKNREKLSQLQFSLAREQAAYQKRNSERIAAYDADAEAERLSYQQRQDENTTRLNEELATLNRHRDSVQAIRDVVLLDEIDTLKRTRAEQLKALDQQRQDALSSATGSANAAGKAFSDNFKKYLDETTANSANAGANAGRSFSDRFSDAIRLAVNDPNKFFSPLFRSFQNLQDLVSGRAEVVNGQVVPKGRGNTDIYGNVRAPGYSSGGFTGRGGKYEVAGQVHRGEYVVPKEDVNQSTGLPYSDALGGSSSSSNRSNVTQVNVTMDVKGLLATSPMALRDFSNDVLANINQTLKSKGIPELGTA